jgi:hypothetical protein
MPMKVVNLNYSTHLEPIVGYYYDNIHWSEDIFPKSTFSNWLEKEYGATYNFVDQSLLFRDDKNFTHFALRWL